MGSSKRLLALDSLRGIFALKIVLLHAAIDWHFFDAALVRNGYIGVQFFFALSGFVIAMSYGQRLRTANEFFSFIVFRVARLWPLHAFVLILFLIYYGAIYFLRGKGPFGTDDIYATDWIWAWNLREVFFLNTFTNDTMLFANFPAWSINAEFWTYVTFGAIFFGLSRFGVAKYIVAIAVAVVSWSIASGLITASFGAAWGWSLFQSVFFFACGAAAYYTWRSHVLRLVLGNTFAECIAVILWVALLIDVLPHRSFIIAIVVFLLLISFGYGHGAVSRALAVKPLVRLGELSYSIYLTHIFVLTIISTVLREAARLTGSSVMCEKAIDGNIATVLCLPWPWLNNLLVVFCIGLIVFFSRFTYACIEVPGQKLAYFMRQRVS